MRSTNLLSIFAAYLKHAVVILLLVSLLAQSFNKLLVVINFQLNRDYIAKNLCENRDKPMMHCNGKCHMMKMLKQEEKKDNQNPERKTENQDEVLSSKSFFYSLSIFTEQIAPVYHIPPGSPIINMPRSIFHPPGA